MLPRDGIATLSRSAELAGPTREPVDVSTLMPSTLLSYGVRPSSSVPLRRAIF
jgi:hypothetical protein